MCTAKHFVAYSTPIERINLGSNVVSERSLRNLHLYPFRKVVKEAEIYSILGNDCKLRYKEKVLSVNIEKLKSKTLTILDFK